MKKLLILLTLTALPLSTEAIACSFDTDCAIGSKCLKKSGALYGICAEGTNPGNSNDRQPVYAPLDLNRSYGNTCSYDLDCGIGSVCAKSRGSMTGVCIKK